SWLGDWLFNIYFTNQLLEQIRATLVGKLLLGTTFAWWDFPHYVVGCFLGWLWLRQLQGKSYANKGQS
ncbi:hypothetical protein CEN43_10430, partial [Fischerella thermalis BR2B]|uniref:DUF2809 domain-containing protein n=1 Tax=Fischerella thermalis TaxID=372787 RepID=UPI000CB957BB